VEVDDRWWVNPGTQDSDRNLQSRHGVLKHVEFCLELRDALELDSLILKDLPLILEQLIEQFGTFVQQVNQAIVFLAPKVYTSALRNARHLPARLPVRRSSHVWGQRNCTPELALATSSALVCASVENPITPL